MIYPGRKNELKLTLYGTTNHTYIQTSVHHKFADLYSSYSYLNFGYLFDTFSPSSKAGSISKCVDWSM